MPLQKKQERKARKEMNPPELVADEPSGEGQVYIHNPAKGIALPNHPDKIFAIMRVKGNQHKVTRDARVIFESLGEEYTVGQQLIFDEVLMIGTPDYTSLGRPTVANARVFATIEEISNAEKVIVFKKKRRKGYQKSAGHK